MAHAPNWLTNIGLELTYLPPKKLVGERIQKAMKCTGNKLKRKFDIDQRNGFTQSWLDVSNDCGALEVALPVLNSMEEVKEWYTVLGKIAATHKYYPQNGKDCSGGGHIHFDTQSPEETLKMFRDFCNRPYLNWFFNDDSDYYNGCNPWYVGHAGICKGDNCYWFRKIDWQHKRTPRVLTNKSEFFSDLPKLKCYGMKFCGAQHLEARFFRAPEDWPEQQAHIEFMQAWLGWVRRQESIVGRRLSFKRRLKEFSFNTCIKEFRGMIAMLDLDWRNYERFVPNFESRWHVYGPDYLT